MFAKQNTKQEANKDRVPNFTPLQVASQQDILKSQECKYTTRRRSTASQIQS
jgi:hypothetical protein